MLHSHLTIDEALQFLLHIVKKKKRDEMESRINSCPHCKAVHDGVLLGMTQSLAEDEEATPDMVG